MLYYHKGTITVSWKNAPETEDTPGQRILYSQSNDGVVWTKATMLFPNMYVVELVQLLTTAAAL